MILELHKFYKCQFPPFFFLIFVFELSNMTWCVSEVPRADQLCLLACPGVSCTWALGWAWASVDWQPASPLASWATRVWEARLSSPGFSWAWSSSWFSLRSWVSTGSSSPSSCPQNKTKPVCQIPPPKKNNLYEKICPLFCCWRKKSVKWGKINCKKKNSATGDERIDGGGGIIKHHIKKWSNLNNVYSCVNLIVNL